MGKTIIKWSLGITAFLLACALLAGVGYLAISLGNWLMVIHSEHAAIIDPLFLDGAVGVFVFISVAMFVALLGADRNEPYG